METETYIDVEIGNQTHRLAPNSVVGSGPHCDLRLISPEISSFHAAFTVREGEWTLLALRGLIATSEKMKRCDEIPLGPGVAVHVPGGFKLVVSACSVGPQLRLILRDGQGQLYRPARRASVGLGPDGQIEVCAGHLKDMVHLTASEDGVFVQAEGGGAVTWVPHGATHALDLGGQTLHFETEEVHGSLSTSTVLPIEIRLRRPLVEVRLRGSGDPTRRIALSGKQSLLLQELIEQHDLSMSRSQMFSRLWTAEVRAARDDKARWEDRKLVLDARLAVLVSQTNANIKGALCIKRNLIVSQKRDLRLDLDPERYDLIDLNDEGDEDV